MTGSRSLPTIDHAPRLSAVRERCEALGVDAAVVTDLTDVRYLTGFTGSAGQLAIVGDRVVLTSDGRYGAQIIAQLAGSGLDDVVEVVIGRPGEQDAALAELLAGDCRVGLQADLISWAAAEAWRERLPGAEVVALSDLLGPLRAVKDPGEVARIEAAASITDGALATCLAVLAARPTELDFARELDRRILDAGAEALSFETIVASGPNGALPHARPSNRTISAGELVVVDVGAVVDGYHSDMTRTFVVGEPDSEAAAMLDAVLAAQDRGVAAVRPGATCAEVDQACRSYLEDLGLGEEFVHGTGHGVGLVIHEAPWVNANSDTELVPGHVVTVEPGVYRAGFGGVRIEDTVLVTADGARRLTAAPKAPVIDTGSGTGRNHGDLHR